MLSLKKPLKTDNKINTKRIAAMDNVAFKKAKNSKAAYHIENKDKIIFWAPIFSSGPYSEEGLLLANATNKSNIIGYVKTVFTTAVLDKELNNVFRNSMILPTFFLIPMWLVILYFVNGITKPLNTLTAGVTAVGTSGSANKVPVETQDEIGKLAEAFNNMVTSLEIKEAEKQQVQEQLRQSQKIEAVGTLAGGVAHDFNNILNIITGYGSLIRKKVTFKSNEKKYIDNLISTAERASSITQSLLTFSRHDAISLRPVDINNTVTNMENILNRFLSSNIKLNIDLSKNDLTILSDPGLIEQVLINLITNAKYAMPDGGTVTISTDSLKTGNELNVTSGKIPPGDYAVITVKDTGIGMDSATKDKIFDPFFTTKEVGKGTGLGLSMVYAIIQQHKGQINVTTTPGKGTSFKLYLKLTDLPLCSTEDCKLTEPAAGTETILIAEDNDELRILTTDILKEYGYKIITAQNGEDAIIKFREEIENIDLLLLDVIMPKKNGMEVLNAARKLRPDIKTLFISAYTGEILKKDKKLFSDSKASFLQKPFLPENLLTRVRNILDS